MKALVTGGAGFIGSHIVEALLREGHEVTVFDDLTTGSESNISQASQTPKNGPDSQNTKNTPNTQKTKNPQNTPAARLVRGSVTDKAALEKALAGMEVVFHEAALVSVAESITNPRKTWDINIRGTKLLLNAAVKAKVKRVIFASSAAIYGNTLPPLKEERMAKPISPYGDSKRMGEMLMEEYSAKEGLETISLRYFNVYGPRQSPKSPYSGVITIFMDRMMRGGRPTIFGNGSQTRDFVFVEDIARANLLAAKAPKKSAKGQAYNIASGKETSLLALAKVMNAALGTQLEPEFAEERKGDIKFSVAEVAAAKKALGFEAQVPLEDGLKKTAEWLRASAGKTDPKA